MLTFETDPVRQQRAPELLTLAEEQRIVALLNGLISEDDTFTEAALLQRMIDSYRYMNGQRLKKIYLAATKKGRLRKLPSSQPELF